MKKRLILLLLICALLSSFPAAYAGKSEAAGAGNAARSAETAAAEENGDEAASETEQEENAENAQELTAAETAVTENEAEEASGKASAEEPAEEKSADPDETDYSGVLASDESAVDFLEGYWTNGRSDYIYAGRGDELISWQTNLPYPASSLYVLEDGILKGKLLDSKSQVVSYDIFSLEIVDRDTLKVKSFYAEEETLFKRDSFSVDSANLSSEYVFWTMERAAVYLEGEWMSPDLDYFIMTNGDTLSFSTNLPCPDGTEMGFCDLEMCAITADANGKKSFEKAYGFEIIGKDTMKVHCYGNGQDYEFSRISADMDPDNLDPGYVFYCDRRAYSFLMGNWSEKTGEHYFNIMETDGNISWKTSLPLEKHYSYRFAHGGLMGVDYDENDDLTYTELYQFDIVSRDEIKITVAADGETYTLCRKTE